MLAIIIPTYNRPNHLETILYVLSRLPDTSWFNIIVLDNCSWYNARELVDRYGHVLVIRLHNASVNSGSMESNIARLGEGFDIGKFDYVWVLGDDDLPITNAVILMGQMLKLHDLRNSIIIFSDKVESLITTENGNWREFSMVSEYFNELIRCNLFDSELGLTFISNVIMRRETFEEIYLSSDGPYIDQATPSNLSVLAFLAQQEPKLDAKCISIVAVCANLVRVAFSPLILHRLGQRSGSIVDDPLQVDAPNSANGAAHTSNIDKVLRAYLATWLAISPNILFFENYNSRSANWFLGMVTYYSEIVVSGLRRSLGQAKISHYEFFLFCAYIKRLALIVDSIELSKEHSWLNSRKANHIFFHDASLGSNGMFSPIGGWISPLTLAVKTL